MRPALLDAALFFDGFVGVGNAVEPDAGLLLVVGAHVAHFVGVELDGHAAEGLLDLAVGSRFRDFEDGVVGGDVGVEAGFDAFAVFGADAHPVCDLADDLDFTRVYVAIGLGDAVHVLQQEQALAVLHHALDLSANGAGVYVLLQDFAEGQDVAVGLGVAEIAHEEALHVVQLGLEDAAVGLHDRRAEDDHGCREVTGAGLPLAGTASARPGARLGTALHGEAVVRHHGSKGIPQDAANGSAQSPAEGASYKFCVSAHRPFF